MQALVPTGEHNPAGHTAQQIRDAISGRTGSRRWSFRYDLLDSANTFIQPLDGIVERCTISHDRFADIKRTAKLHIRDTGRINYLSDRIQPWARLHLPPYGNNDWVEWPQGVFLLSTPVRSAAQWAVTRQVEGYDLLQVYLDDKVSSRYTVAGGDQPPAVKYTDAVSALLGSVAKNITASAATLPVTREWDPGTSKLEIINNLLSGVNYESLWFDERGTAMVQPYVAPSLRPAEWTYADDENGLIIPQVDQELDLFNTPNQWTIVVSAPDRPVLTSTYTNSDPASPTSTVRRGRTIVDFRTEQDAADQETLDAKVARLAFEASQVYELLVFEAGAVPHHSGNDVCWVSYSPLAISAKFTSRSWEWELKAGQPMKHAMRRVVSV